MLSIKTRHLCLHSCCVVTWLQGLCHPAVHSHPFDCWILLGERVEVRPALQLLPVAATLVGAAGGAYAVCGRPPHLWSGGWGGGGVVVSRAMNLCQVPWLTEVVVGRGAWLGLDVDAVVRGDRETGAHWPTNTEKEVLCLWLWGYDAI